MRLVGAAVANIEASTQELKRLGEKSEKTQELVLGTRRELQAHHGASVERFNELRDAIQAVPARTDEKLAPRFETLQQLLAVANSMVEDIAKEVKARAQKTTRGADGQAKSDENGGDGQKAPSGDGGGEARESGSAEAKEAKAQEALKEA